MIALTMMMTGSKRKLISIKYFMINIASNKPIPTWNHTFFVNTPRLLCSTLTLFYNTLSSIEKQYDH